MNVLFVNYYDFTSNSAIHLFNLANELDRAGVGSAVAVTDDPAGVDLIGRPRFQALDFREARRGELRFPDGGPPSVVHAWTPREGGLVPEPAWVPARRVLRELVNPEKAGQPGATGNVIGAKCRE